MRRPQHWSCHSSPGRLYRKASLIHWRLLNTGPLMVLTSVLLCAFALALRSYGKPAALETRNSLDLLCTCNDIATAISGTSQVFFPRMSSLIYDNFILMGGQASPEYLLDISHAAPSSSQVSTCSVEPGSAEDVSKIVSYLDLMHQLLPTHFS